MGISDKTSEKILEEAEAAAAAAKQAAVDAADAASRARDLADQLSTGLNDVTSIAAHSLSGGVIDPFVFRLSIFVLAIFIGYYVVWSVTPALHTPLMSVTNAVSSVIIVGALLAVSVDSVSVDFINDDAGFARSFGFIALVFASINIFGGFMVTQRMLAMYKRKQR